MQIENVTIMTPGNQKEQPPPRTHRTPRTHKTPPLTDNPQSTDRTYAMRASYDNSDKPANNRRHRKPTRAPNHENTTVIPNTTTENNCINSPDLDKKYITSTQTFDSSSHIKKHYRLTDNMEDERPQSSSTARSRRTNQRYRRGAHNVTLDSSARLALT